ncbi:TrmH family RNA methyltransferase [Candidatus Margulisiibacteriota bacterium]
MIEKITSLKNPKIVHIKNLINEKKYRDKHKEFIVEGLKNFKELQPAQISYVIISEQLNPQEYPGTTYLVPHTLLTKLSDTKTTQGLIAVVKQPASSLEQVDQGKWIIAENIQDPGNLGTIIRTIEASGAQGLIYTEGTVDPFAPKVVRAATGSSLRIPLIKVKNVEELKESLPAIRLIATVVSGGNNYLKTDLTGFCAIILGSEGQGISAESSALADVKVSIPLKGNAESLNVATTAAALLFKS